MKTVILVTMAWLVAADIDYYITEKLDTDALIGNSEELLSFAYCISGVGQCKKEYVEYKNNAKEILIQACKRCTAEQKEFVWLFIDTLKTKFPEDFTKFKNTVDPENKYFNILEKEVEKYKTA